jgi:hypothetical protein
LKHDQNSDLNNNPVKQMVPTSPDHEYIVR